MFASSLLFFPVMFIPGVTAMLWVPPTDSVTSALASVSASPASPASTVSAARSTTSGSDLKAANVRAVAGTEPQSPPLPGRATVRSRGDSDSLSPQGSPPGHP